MSFRYTSLKKPEILFIIVGLVVFAFLLVQPLPPATMENCVKHEGAVESVSDGPSGDIVIRLKNHKASYYINRGEESGLTVSKLEALLVNKHVELLTIKNPSPLSGPTSSQHIAQVKFDDSVVYSEL